MVTAFFLILSAGFALGCIYTLLRSRRSRDESDMQLQSLKQAAGDMIKSGSMTGLNPHKVYKFCIQYEQMSADNKELSEELDDMCSQTADVLRDCDNFEGIYNVPEWMLLDILEKNDTPTREAESD